jgi:hypothetical protein
VPLLHVEARPRDARRPRRKGAGLRSLRVRPAVRRECHLALAGEEALLRSGRPGRAGLRRGNEGRRLGGLGRHRRGRRPLYRRPRGRWAAGRLGADGEALRAAIEVAAGARDARPHHRGDRLAAALRRHRRPRPRRRRARLSRTTASPARPRAPPSARPSTTMSSASWWAAPRAPSGDHAPR